MNFPKKVNVFLKKHRASILIAISYTIIAFFVCYPLFQDISHSLIPGDGLFTYWTMSWDIHSFLHDPGNILNANIFYPNKNTLVYSEGLFVPAIIAFPMYLLIGNMIIVYNLLIFFSYILAAFGAFKLAKYYTKNTYASFIAGLIFGFATFRISSLGHFQNLMIFWMPFTILYLQKYFDTTKRKYLVVFSLFFSAQLLSCWNMGAYLAFLVCFLFILNYKIILKNFSSFLKDGIISFVIIVVLVSPFAYPYLKLSHEESFSYPLGQVINGSADLGGYIISPPKTIMSRVTSYFGIEKKHWGENKNFLGYFSLFLIAYYLLFAKNKIGDKRFQNFLWGIPTFMVLSFGPVLNFIPQVHNFPLPFSVLVPFVGFIRTPSRISIIVLLCVAMVVAYIVSSIKIKNYRLKLIVSFFIPLIILIEFWAPKNRLFNDTNCSEMYSSIGNNKSIKGLLEFPAFPDPDRTLFYMYKSTCHFKPIFNGYSGYNPKSYFKDIAIIEGFPNDESIRRLKKLKISHVLLHLKLVTPEKQSELMESVKNDGRLEIIDTKDDVYLIKLKK